ncbi:MAG TPA: hypothetical protein DIU20_06470 [Cryomorphaceae bacterium]|nr:hypothetical protein [Cryomorphaceae bacterium]
MSPNYSTPVKRIAQAGLISKGIVYFIFGVLILMAVFSHGNEPVQLFAILKYIINLGWLGRLVVILLTIGLFCYSLWKFFQMVFNTEGYKKDLHGYFIRITWLGPFIFYMVLGGHSTVQLYRYYAGSFAYGNTNSSLQSFMYEQGGSWFIVFLAATFFLNACSLFYLGFTGKYTLMLTGQRFYDNSPRFARITGFLGYVMYGFALLIIAFLFAAALYYSDPSMAQGGESMFDFLKSKSYGVFMLMAIATGTMCYGFYFFVASFYRWQEDKPSNQSASSDNSINTGK